MSALAKPTGPGPLSVRESANGDGRQFAIESDYLTRDGEWADIYVSLTGYAGAYGPHLFAAAPILLSAAHSALVVLRIVYERSPGTNEAGAIAALEEAIAKAEARP